MSLKIYFDGGCRPNPGPMETAVVVRGVTYLERDLGTGDNNEAEWLALLQALRTGMALAIRDVTLIGDSAFVIDQVRSGQCRQLRFRPYLDSFHDLAAGFDAVKVRQVGRWKNLAGIALDRSHNGL